MTTRSIAIGILGLTIGMVAALSVTALGGTGSSYVSEKEGDMQHSSASFRVSKGGYNITRLPIERIDELAGDLTDEEAKVILRRGTEQAFCGNLVDTKQDGLYICRLCSLPLFASDSKFTSRSGWPSFFQPVDPEHVGMTRDASLGMVRTEIHCERCSAHLGHLFDDGPKPTGLRFCLNSASLTFFKNSEPLPKESLPLKTESAYFAGGCFWGVEDRFQQVPGVMSAVSGYQGGALEAPSYDAVCAGKTGHAESVKVTYDPAMVSYEELLEWFFMFHDPTQLNRQGPDFGTQYRSAIYTHSPEQIGRAHV